jgi:hypothetical protein
MNAMFAEILAGLKLPQSHAENSHFVGEVRLPSYFPVSELAAASIGAAGASISELCALIGLAPKFLVDYRLASLWFGWSLRPQGWEMPSPWDAIAGDYQTSDGWIKLHTNAPHHRAAALSVLQCPPTRDSVAVCVATWSGDDLEAAIVAAGGCAAKLRTAQEWQEHPQGVAVSEEPLADWSGSSACKANGWQPTAERPLSGLRVLDLTRIIAGPVATRFLAGFGADVLRIDPLGWDEIGVIPEVSLGKRCVRLDLKSDAGRAAFHALLSQADILVHGYRGDALEKLGYGADARQSIRPGLIDISLNAYGHCGPWSQRRGFDSLVQFSSGIAAAGMDWRRSDIPVSLPVQALDHATGYLMAAAAIRALIGAVKGEGAICARLSLARTAKLLMDNGAQPTDDTVIVAIDSDYLGDLEQTDWGPAQRLLPPLHIEGAPMQWELPAQKLGTSAPHW